MHLWMRERSHWCTAGVSLCSSCIALVQVHCQICGPFYERPECTQCDIGFESAPQLASRKRQMLASLAYPVAGAKPWLARGHAGACSKIRGGSHQASAPCRSGRQLCVKPHADNEQPSTSGRDSIEEDIWAAPRQQQQRRQEAHLATVACLAQSLHCCISPAAWTHTTRAMLLCRPSYKAIAGLTVAGAALTAYLTVQKVTGAPVVCLASGGCGSVLNSDYATVFGIPLSLLGLLGYGSTAALALAGAAAGSREAPLPRYGVLAGSTVLATCSACLL